MAFVNTAAAPLFPIPSQFKLSGKRSSSSAHLFLPCLLNKINQQKMNGWRGEGSLLTDWLPLSTGPALTQRDKPGRCCAASLD